MAKKRSSPKTRATKPPTARSSRAGSTGFTFDRLVGSIHAVHSETAAQASRAVNLSLTLRNWLIGCYIDAYELRGKDRAAYGEKLLDIRGNGREAAIRRNRATTPETDFRFAFWPWQFLG